MRVVCKVWKITTPDPCSHCHVAALCEIYSVSSSSLKICVVSAGNSLLNPVTIKDLWEIKVTGKVFSPSSSGLSLSSFLSMMEKCVPHCHYSKIIPAAKQCKFDVTQSVLGTLWSISYCPWACFFVCVSCLGSFYKLLVSSASSFCIKKKNIKILMPFY